MKLHDNQYEVAPITRLDNVSQDRYNSLIDGYRNLFEASRYPNTSTHICEQSLVINVAPQYGVFATHALLQAVQPGYGKFAAGYDKADGFSVMWYDRERSGKHTLTHTDKVYAGKHDVGLWLLDNECRAKEVQQILHDALRDDSINPQKSVAAYKYSAAKLLGFSATRLR